MTLASREAIAKICWEPYFHNPCCATGCTGSTSLFRLSGARKTGFRAQLRTRVSKGSADGRFVSIPKAATFRISNSQTGSQRR